MKKTMLSLALIITASLSYSQQWSGSSSTNGNIIRSGNVGIGTSTPLNRLQLGSSMSFHDGGNEIIGFGFAPGAGANSDLNTSRYSSEIRLDPVNGVFSLGTSTSITGNPVRTLVMTRLNRVGIGTANPDEKLTVNGSIHAREVRVDLDIPADYVFEKYYDGHSELKSDYEMPTLDEIANYTKTNKHLPGIPSAKKIKEEGLYLKEMTNLLLQKIEELTLYTIEQEEKLKSLEKKLNELK